MRKPIQTKNVVAVKPKLTQLDLQAAIEDTRRQTEFDIGTILQAIPSYQDGSVLPCPFCGEYPFRQFWHGGAATAQMLSCDNTYCHASPKVVGKTPDLTTEFWNKRA